MSGAASQFHAIGHQVFTLLLGLCGGLIGLLADRRRQRVESTAAIPPLLERENEP